MVILIKKLGIFILVFYLLSIPVQKILDYGLRRSNLSTQYKEWNDIFESKLNSDLLFMGSSRASFTYSPFIADSALKINSYNIGIDGFGFSMQYSKLLNYLNYNKKPKYIIYSLDATSLVKEKTIFNYNQFLPFLNNKYIQNSLKRFESMDLMDIYIPYYKYSHNKLLFIKCIKSIFKNEVNQDQYKGYYVQNQFFAKNKYHKLLTEKKFVNILDNVRDTTIEKYFIDFLDYCKYHGIKVIFVYTPEFRFKNKVIYEHDSINEVYYNIAKKYNIPYLDYLNISISSDSSCFYDVEHLNAKGSVIFNNLLVNDLKNILH